MKPRSALLPLLAIMIDAVFAAVGKVAGAAYVIVMWHVPPIGSIVAGVVEQVLLPAVVGKLNNPVPLSRNAVVPSVSGAVPVLVTVATLVTAARGVGIVKVSVGASSPAVRTPLVTEVIVSAP